MMMMLRASDIARAYPVSDVRRPRLTSVRNGQGLPGFGRSRLNKLVPVRVGTLNVGSMTGRGRELADLMERRKVGVLCVQETRWKGNKARELGGDCKLFCKLFYSGADERGRNGVGIVLSKEFKDSLVSASRTNDRVMSVKLGIGETVVNVICAYAPQAGCEDEEKETFWRQMDQDLRAIPEGERVIVGGDLNGHVGISREATVAGEWERRTRKEKG